MKNSFKIILFSLVFSSIFSFFTVLNTEEKINLISYKHPTNPQIIGLKMNRSFKGEFKAKENNLGIVVITIKNPDFINEELIFRLKEKGSTNWYYENRYYTVGFPESSSYPFGFPIINNSKNKIYSFELILVAKYKDASMLVDLRDSIITKYLFTLKHLREYPADVFIIIANKISYSIENKIFYKIILFYNLPLLYFIVNEIFRKYLSGVQIKNKYLRESKKIFDSWSLPFFTLISFYAIIIKNHFDMLLVLIILSWIFLVYKYKKKPVQSYLLSLVFLVICSILSMLNIYSLLDKASILSYTFLAIGSAHTMVIIISKQVHLTKNKSLE